MTKLGGKHVHLLLLEKGLKELGVKVVTVYYNPKSLGEIIKRSTRLLLGGKYGYKLKLNWMIKYLRKHIPKNAFEMIHAHDVLSLISAVGRPEKKVLTLHGYFARENIEFIKNEKVRKQIYPYLLQLEKEGIEKADYVIAVDQRIKEYVISEFNYPAEKISVMHNAIDTNQFKPVSEEKQKRLKKKFGFGEDDIIILVPRRLVEKNGVIYAVQAMKHIKNEKVKMVIAGDGPEREKIVKEKRGDNRIQLVGIIPHSKITPYYLMADIILIPSITSHGIQEATSLAMLEGMACGKVTICSNIGGMGEIIQHMKNGILIKEKDSEMIAKTIEFTLTNKNLMTEIGNKAREYVLENHSFVAHARKVYNIYNTLLRDR
ncbi:MAG: glycosyltransferase family 4 protein [Candidatus Bathyarchaeota archaeon]|nr:glycosyltransferase family 4 protein [Candidatus Bathyarchaeota archaeon]